MKPTLQFITSLLVLFAKASEFGGYEGLPYEHLMSSEMMASYWGLVGILDHEQLHAMIKGDLEDMGILEAAPRADAFRFQREPSPPPRQPSPPRHTFADGDYLPDDFMPDELLMPIEETRPSPVPPPAYQDFQDGDYLPDDFMPEELPQEHREQTPPAEEIPDALRNLDDNELDAEGRPYGPAGVRTVVSQPMTAAERELNGLYNGPNPLLTETEGELAHFLSRASFLFQAMGFLVAYPEGTDGPQVYQIAPLNRIIRVLSAAIDVDNFEVFNFVCQLMAIDAQGLPEFQALLNHLTAPSTDRRYLASFLQHGCSPKLASALFARMNRSNMNLHQVLVDSCGQMLHKKDGCALLSTTEVQEALVEYWMSEPSGEIVEVEQLNVLGAETSGVVEKYADEDVQIVCLLSATGMPLPLGQMKSIDAMRRRLERSSAQSEMQRRFVCIHINKRTGVATVMKSPQLDGPSCVVLHMNSTSYTVDGAMNAALYQPFEQRQLLERGNGLRVASCQLAPGDIIVALPQVISQAEGNTMPDFLISVFSGASNLQTSEDILDVLKEDKRLADFKEHCEILLGVIHWTEEMIQQASTHPVPEIDQEDPLHGIFDYETIGAVLEEFEDCDAEVIADFGDDNNEEMQEEEEGQ